MAKIASASQIKASLKGNGKRGPVPQQEPRPGTKLRAFYDALMANKGQIVNATHVFFGDKNHANSCARQLTDFYGLDVLPVYRASWMIHYVLLGEWFGRVYVDYMAGHSVAEMIALYEATVAGLARPSAAAETQSPAPQ